MEAEVYELILEGHLNPEWAAWFEGLCIEQLPDGRSRVWGPVHDQPALHGLLEKIRDLNLKLIEVRRIS